MAAERSYAAVLDGSAARRWADLALSALSAARGEIDRLNVYPIADSDTGTNLVRTMQAGVGAVRADPARRLGPVLDVLASATLYGACGNSGTILSQLLRGLADAAGDADSLDPAALARALAHAAAQARAALARPVEGTILSVADAAAVAAASQASSGADLAATVQAAAAAAGAALSRTPDQLAALHGRPDAGGRGLVVLLDALVVAVSGDSAPAELVGPGMIEEELDPIPSGTAVMRLPVGGGPSHEVMYLLDTVVDEDEPGRVATLREQLAGLGDSVVVVGGSGRWQVHAHVDDVGAALELGLSAGRPHRVRVTAFAAEPEPAGDADALAGGLGVVAVVEGAGLGALLAGAGALVLDPGAVRSADPGRPTDDSPDPPLAAAILRAVHELLALGSASVAVLPGSAAALSAADAAAALSSAGRPGAGGSATGSPADIRVVRTRSAVQAIAALAVHDPRRDVARDLLEMSTAAAATRHGLVEIAAGDGLTSAGWCHAGDVLGHVDGDVAVIGTDLAGVGGQVVDLLLGGGGELVTLVSGALADPELAGQVGAAVRRRRPDVEVTAYAGGPAAAYLLVGVE